MARKNKGFTIIELLIIVAIIGILVTLAIPAYLSFISKSRRAEAKYNLEGIYKAQTSWFGENNTFSDSFTTIRWQPDGVCQYTYFLGGVEYRNRLLLRRRSYLQMSPEVPLPRRLGGISITTLR
jgi:prepilin-type N-terminal cleavage/methylation domain-containing protein